MKFLLCFLPVAVAFSVVHNGPSPPPPDFQNEDPPLFEPGVPEPPFEPEVVDEPENIDWMTMAGAFEGDILLTEEQERQLRGIDAEDRNIIKDTNKKWLNNEIPYIIDSGAGYSSSQISTIENALATYSQNTNGCVKVVKRTNQRDYIKIINGEGCYSFVGRTGGEQVLSLKKNGCVWTSTVIHEFLHAAGFWHEQSRADRDNYVIIHMNNVQSGKEHNFNKHSLSYTQLIGAYDYYSVMHYSDKAFSKNGQKTITRKDGGSTNFGNRSGFSNADVQKLMTLYQCSGGGSTTAPTTVTTRSTTVPTTVTTRSTTVPTTVTTTTAGTCTNILADSQCSSWASRNYCKEVYVEFMSYYCKKTCNRCMTTACNNLNGNCDYWAGRGYCTRQFVSFMRINCRKSCNLC